MGGPSMPDEDGRHVARSAVTVALAMREDLRRVADIEQVSFSDPWSARTFGSLIEEPRVYFAVARDGADRVIGYIVAWMVADEAEIANLAVAPEARRGGVGRSLLDAALDTARGHGVHTVYLEVRESNAAARALYARRGFVEIGRRRGYYRRPLEDAILLRSEISAAPSPETPAVEGIRLR